MPYEYKRRRPSIIRNFWVYRRLIGTAILLGLMLWFIWANHEQVTVAFPFGLGKLTSTTGVVILLSALGRLAGDDPGHNPRLRHQAHPQHANPARSPQPDRTSRRSPPRRLRRQNHRRVSQRSLVKLTKIREWARSPFIRLVTVAGQRLAIATGGSFGFGPCFSCRARPIVHCRLIAAGESRGDRLVFGTDLRRFERAAGCSGRSQFPDRRPDRRPAQNELEPPGV